jgi:hypothetical protein
LGEAAFQSTPHKGTMWDEGAGWTLEKVVKKVLVEY